MWQNAGSNVQRQNSSTLPPQYVPRATALGRRTFDLCLDEQSFEYRHCKVYVPRDFRSLKDVPKENRCLIISNSRQYNRVIVVGHDTNHISIDFFQVERTAPKE